MTRERRTRSTAEWVVFAVSAAIVLSVAGAIGWLWTQPYDPARVTVEQVGEPRVQGNQTYITAEVTNDGDETAENVQVHAEMSVDGETVGEGEQIVDFLSGREAHEVVFVFDDVPPTAEIELRVASFDVP